MAGGRVRGRGRLAAALQVSGRRGPRLAAHGRGRVGTGRGGPQFPELFPSLQPGPLPSAVPPPPAAIMEACDADASESATILFLDIIYFLDIPAG